MLIGGYLFNKIDLKGKKELKIYWILKSHLLVFGSHAKLKCLLVLKFWALEIALSDFKAG